MALDEGLMLFMRDSIRSVWAIDILVALRRDRAHAWTSEALANELRSNVRLVSEILAELETAGLTLRQDGRFIYSPADADLDELSSRLEQTYRERPVAVRQAIQTARRSTGTAP